MYSTRFYVPFLPCGPNDVAILPIAVFDVQDALVRFLRSIEVAIEFRSGFGFFANPQNGN